MEGAESKVEQAVLCKKPLNKIIKFTDSDSSGSESDDADDNEDTNNDHAKDKTDVQTGANEDEIVLATSAGGSDESTPEIKDDEAQQKSEKNEKPENHDEKEAEAVEPPAKKQCVEAGAPNSEKIIVKTEQKSVDKLIEDELKELGDKSKVSLRIFVGFLSSFEKL